MVLNREVCSQMMSSCCKHNSHRRTRRSYQTFHTCSPLRLLNLRRTKLYTLQFVDCGWVSRPYFSYRRFAGYRAQHVGELLTQRKSRHASGTVFDYDTRNKTLNNKAAQNRQCSTQSVSVNFLNIFFKATRNKHTQKRMFKGPIYILRAPNTGTFINYLLR